MSRRADLVRFYDLLDEIEAQLGGRRSLGGCTARLGWPIRGVYFFFEEGEMRSDSGTGPRIVRVGTHGLKIRSKETLWSRLRAHRGTTAGGGDHRQSVFRKLVGEAIGSRLGRTPSSWGLGNSPGAAARSLGVSRAQVRQNEAALERETSTTIGSMSVLWVAVDDDPSPDSLRGRIERGAIALLSNAGRPPFDVPSPGWLGRDSAKERVRESGLWNQDHVDRPYDPSFVASFERLLSG